MRIDKSLKHFVYITFPYVVPLYLNVLISVWTLEFMIPSQNMKQCMVGTSVVNVLEINLHYLSMVIMIKNANPRTITEKVW